MLPIFDREVVVVFEVQLAFQLLFEDENHEFPSVTLLVSLGSPLGFLLTFNLEHLHPVSFSRMVMNVEVIICQ